MWLTGENDLKERFVQLLEESILETTTNGLWRQTAQACLRCVLVRQLSPVGQLVYSPITAAQHMRASLPTVDAHASSVRKERGESAVES